MMDVNIGSRKGAPQGERFKAWSGAKRALARARGEQGQALLETALLLTVLLPIMAGIISFGIAIGNYLILTNATTMAAQAFSVTRGQSSDACKTAYQAFEVGAPTLAPTNLANLTFTFAVSLGPNQTCGSGATCTYGPTTFTGTAPTCVGALEASSTNTVFSPLAGSTGSVTVTYPCNLTIVGISYASSCKLTAQTSEAFQ